MRRSEVLAIEFSLQEYLQPHIQVVQKITEFML